MLLFYSWFKWWLGVLNGNKLSLKLMYDYLSLPERIKRNFKLIVIPNIFMDIMFANDSGFSLA